MARMLAPSCAPQEQARAMRRFALVEVAGKLAVRFGVLPYSLEDVVDATKAAIGAWLSEADTLTDAQRGVEALKDFIKGNPERFRNSNDRRNGGEKFGNLVGYVDRTEKKVEGLLYLFTDAGLKEACAGHSVREVLGELDRLGALFRNRPDRIKSSHSIDGFGKNRVQLYAVHDGILKS